MSSQSDATDDAMPRRTAMLGAGLFAFATGAVPAASARDAVPAATGHVVLLGDSVFDNAGYLAGRGPDVVGQSARAPARRLAGDAPGPRRIVSPRMCPGNSGGCRRTRPTSSSALAATMPGGGKACSPSRRAAWRRR